MFIICSLLLCSCNREVDFCFDFGSQSLCVYKSSFYNLSIENDSITPDGKSYEGAISLFWTDSANSPPRRIYLDRIPKGLLCLSWWNKIKRKKNKSKRILRLYYNINRDSCCGL